MIVNLDELTLAVRETFPASFAEVCHNVLQTVSIFLLIRQQLQRIDQVCAQALHYRMRFEDLRLLNTTTGLYDQKPIRLLPIVLFSTNCAPLLRGFSPRDPPNVVLHGETVAVQAQVRHCDSSLPSRSHNDSPQVVRTLEHDLLHNAHLFDVVLCYLLKGFLNSVKGAFRGFRFSSEGLFLFFPRSIFFKAVKPFFIIDSLQSMSWQHFTFSKYSLAGDSSCH